MREGMVLEVLFEQRWRRDDVLAISFPFLQTSLQKEFRTKEKEIREERKEREGKKKRKKKRNSERES